MNRAVIFYVLGKLVLAETAILAVPLALALAWGEPSAFALFLSVLISGGAGCILQRSGRYTDAPLTKRDGIAITGFGWLIATALGMLPYLLDGCLPPLDALFESISGFTGTGATVIDVLEPLPQSILFWRMMTHWFGGLGIIVIFIALLPQTGQSTIYMYNAETTGAGDGRMLPRLQGMTKVLFSMYIAFTLAATIVYMLCGLSPWDAVTHAMSTIGAGGFSTHSTSAAHFASVPLEVSMTFFMILAGGNFGLYYRVFSKGLASLWKNTEFRWYIAILALATLLVTADLSLSMGLRLGDALRFASFQAGSLATTGFVSADFDVWPAFSKGILIALMISGGCAGGAAGGMKVARVVLLVKNACAVVHQKLSPRQLEAVRMNGTIVPPEKIAATQVFFFLYIFFILLFALLLAADGLQVFDALTISVTTLGNVGPAFGIAGATGTYAPLSDFAKSILCAEMLLGRLELFTLLAMATPDFWRLKGRW